MKKATEKLVIGAIIAAVYAGLTFMSNIFGIAYGPVQFRFSEALTVLPVFTPAAIPGLCVGCFISNIASFNPVDMIFGTFATLCASLLSFLLRDIRLKGLPLLSTVMPVLVNAIIIGAEIALLSNPQGNFLTAFTLSALWIALGEAVTCIGLGLLLFVAVSKNKKALKFADYH